ncbi:hypothetical protein GTP23_12785 [Pseudoduganella sp. FT93W]|uniref:Uncharacterized protein n=1 Tax=Duganella fentianensis TaxID=2692177 RepID=A0A845HWZ9_9BURK|nr:hypothetical protein [Duganella fentianensis]MYN45924.1 hypothetical protein [Duganella fentianensis]
MLVPSMLSMAEVMAESGYPEETIFDLGISGEIIFLVIVPEIGACRVPELALSHFMAGADEFPAQSMPSHYQPEIRSGQWTIKRDRLRVLAESWRNWSEIGKALLSISLLPQPEIKTTEQIAAWWDITMDASVWWAAESITPTNAAMLLARWNPNKEKLDSVIDATNDEMGPADLKRLINIFDGADPAIRRTFKEWIDYASVRNIKIHSWVSTWGASSSSFLCTSSQDARPEASTRPAKGLTTRQILNAFSLALDEKTQKTVKSAMDDSAKWVIQSKLSKGTRGGKHLTEWKPVDLALDLITKGYATSSKLTKCFADASLKDWRQEWHDRMELADFP